MANEDGRCWAGSSELAHVPVHTIWMLSICAIDQHASAGQRMLCCVIVTWHLLYVMTLS